MDFAPVILFVYNRPDHTEKTLESLMANELSKETHLFVFTDGPKNDASKVTLKNIELTLAVVKKKKWCSKVTIYENKVNKGLASSVIEGVTKIVNEFEKVIVLEDDMVVSPFFLNFMNDALDVYENEQDVACISGYIYPTKKKLPETFFIKGADCWGWATWKRSWLIFEENGSLLLKRLEKENLCSDFDFDDSYSYTKMLKEQISGANNSWAIRWYAAAFLKNKLCLYPGISFVQNIGVDGSGTHSGISDQWEVDLAKNKIKIKKLDILENKNARKAVVKYFQNLKKGNKTIISHFLGKLKSIVTK